MNLSKKQIDKICKAVRKKCRKEIENSCKRRWKDMSESQKENMRWFVRSATSNLGRVSPQLEIHQHFIRKWGQNGWVYGRIKSSIEMTHPNLLPWDSLPYDVKKTYRIMVDAVREQKELSVVK